MTPERDYVTWHDYATLWVVTGVSGCGKTTVAHDVGQPLNATIVSQDSTLIERERRSGPGFIEKWDLDMADRLLTQLLAHQSIQYMGYSQKTAKRDQWIALSSRPLIIFEGVLPFMVPAVRKYAALTFWVEAPLEVCEARQLARWQRDGWYPGQPEEEVIRRILIKRTEELPIILEQRRLCRYAIDNAVNHEMD